MAKIDVHNMAGEVVGSMDLNDSIFATEANPELVHTVVKNYLMNQRQGTQSTKTRAEVSGGGRKPWKQKGTGRARQGSIRAPQWIHGGIAFGPKPRDYRFSMNKKAKRVALFSVLSSKFAAGEIIVIDNIDIPEIKTKSIITLMKAFSVKKPLLVTAASDINVYKSARNIPGVGITHAGVLNVYEILKHDKFVVSKDAVNKIEEVYAI